ncbi:hypothetical protein CPB86DRAFT_399124 [Serendipita vermifera]|nr:hypothetical protein CPB86DRAFT_399124 [Serendipita vermifera]
MSPFTFADAPAMHIRSLNDMSQPWEAPPRLRAIFSFNISFFVSQVVLLFMILLFIRRLPTWSSCGPYLLLILATFLLAIAHIVLVIYIRLTTDFSHRMADTLWLLSAFLFEIEAGLRPALVLYLLHVRGSIIQKMNQANAFRPLMSELWKRVFDWAFISMNCLIGIALIAYTHYTFTHPAVSEVRASDYHDFRLDLSRACAGLRIVSYMLVVLSCMVMSAQLESRKLVDRVVNRLVATIPFFLLLIVDRLIALVLLSGGDDQISLTFELASVIMQGISRVGITMLLVWTMKLPNVPWTASSPSQIQPPTSFEIVLPSTQPYAPIPKANKPETGSSNDSRRDDL